MKKPTFSAAALCCLVCVSATAQNGQFFVDGGIGRASYGLYVSQSDSDKTDWANSIRAGYMWHGVVDYGLELGYADLGQDVNRFVYTHITGSDYIRYSRAANSWLLGARLEYVVHSWYLMARGGWNRPHITEEGADWALTSGYPWNSVPTSGYSHSQQSFNTGTHGYYGLGVGYCISPHWRAGLNYDYYDLGSMFSAPGYSEPSSHVKTYTVSVQYRL